MKKILLFIGVIAVALIMASCSSSSPKDVTNNYYKALQKGDFEKALSYSTVENNEEIQKEVEKLKGIEMDIKDFEIVSETISEDGQTAEVDVKYSYTSSFNSEPKESTNNVKLVKQDGKWKVKG